MQIILNNRDKIKQKIKRCGKPSFVGALRSERRFRVLQQTCKQVYACDYCAALFQREFTEAANLLANYAEANKLQLFFLTLTYRPIPITELAAELKNIRKAANSFTRRRIQPRSIHKYFNRAIADYRENAEKYRRHPDKKKRSIYHGCEYFCDLQQNYLESFMSLLPAEDARMTHAIVKGLARLEIKVKSKDTVYPHIHAIIAMKPGKITIPGQPQQNQGEANAAAQTQELCGLPKVLISHLWEKSSGSKIVDIEPIHDHKNAAKYVAKYASKASGHHAEGKIAIDIQDAHRRQMGYWWFGSDKTKLKLAKESKYEHVAVLANKHQVETPAPGVPFAARNYKLDMSFLFNYTSVEHVISFDVRKSEKLPTLKHAQNCFRGVLNIEDIGNAFRVTRRAGKWDCIPNPENENLLNHLFFGDAIDSIVANAEKSSNPSIEEEIKAHGLLHTYETGNLIGFWSKNQNAWIEFEYHEKFES